jgi:hypothetical protein
MKWFLLIFLVSSISKAQVITQLVTNQADDTLVTPPVHSSARTNSISGIIQKVERGLQNNSMDYYKTEFGEVVSITISSGEHGYYSANQAVSVLGNYFMERRPVSFEFSSIHIKGSMPYATGSFIYIQKGIQKSVQVYISLTQQNSKWVIGQFNLY